MRFYDEDHPEGVPWNPRFGTFEAQREYYREFIGGRRIDLTEEQVDAAAVYLLNNNTNWVGAVQAVLGAAFVPYPALEQEKEHTHG